MPCKKMKWNNLDLKIYSAMANRIRMTYTQKIMFTEEKQGHFQRRILRIS